MVTHSYDTARSRWGLPDAFIAIAIFFVVSIGFVLAVVAVTGGTSAALEGPLLLITVTVPQGMQVVYITWVGRRKGTGLRNDFHLWFQRSDVLLAAGLFLGGVFAAGAVVAIITQITGETPVSSAVELAEQAGQDGLTIWILLFAVVGATFIPLAEELVFRGLLWSALEKRGVRPGFILIVTSGLFAIIHLELARTPVLFVLGLALGLGRLITGRLGPAVFVHMMINGLAMFFVVAEVVS